MFTICSKYKAYRLLGYFGDLEGSCINEILNSYTFAYTNTYELSRCKKVTCYDYSFNRYK